MAYQNDDLMLINRGGTSYKTEYGLLKQNIIDGVGGAIVSETEPTDDLHEGDFWYKPSTETLSIYVVNETTGIVTALTVRNGGSGYNNAGTDVSTNGGSGSELTVDYQAGVGGALVNPTVNQGGHAYQVSDVLFVTGSGHANGSVTVTAVNTVAVGAWEEVSGGGGDANHNDGPTAPITGDLGDQWFNTDDGRLYTYTADSSGALVWIDASPDSIGGGSGGDGSTTPGVRYQEGDWTPATASGTLSSVADYTSWTRIGNKVTVWADLKSFSSTSGAVIEITQLPFAVAYPSSAGSTTYTFGKVGYSVVTASPSATYNGGSLKFNAPAVGDSDQLKYSNLNSGFIAQVIATYYTDDTTFVPINGAVVTEDIQGTGGSGGSGDGTTVNYNGASAWGSVDAVGALQNGFNVTTTGTGNGEYTVSFVTPMPNDTYAVTSAPNDTNQVIRFQNRSTNGFDLQLSGSVNAAFSFAVHSENAIAPQSGVGADAWAAFDGDGAIGNTTLDGSFNIASVNKAGEGNYVVTFTTPMPSDHYAVSSSYIASATNKTSTGFTFFTYNTSGSPNDLGDVQFSVHASSTVTPTYTWTRDGTTLKPANDGDLIEAGAATFSGVVDGQSEVISRGGISIRRVYSTAAEAAAWSTTPFLNRTTTSDGVYTDATNFAIGGEGDVRMGSDITDQTNGTRVLIRSSGEANFGGDAGNRNGNIKLHADGTLEAGYGKFYRKSSVSQDLIIRGWSDVGGTKEAKWWVRNDGSIQAVSTTITAISSERRLKENITSIEPNTAWETIKSTPYYAYNFIGSDSVCYGPMADEVPTEMVVQSVEPNEAGVMVARSDDEGPIRTFDNGMLQARLYTALQTALTRIETLEAKVTQLEGGNN